MCIFLQNLSKSIYKTLLIMPNRSQRTNRAHNWKKYSYLFNQDKSMSFECFCGKSYSSFPALYIHFRKIHDEKISTNPALSRFEISSNNGITLYKYFKSQEKRPQVPELENQQQFKSKQEIQNVFSDFLEDTFGNCQAEADDAHKIEFDEISSVLVGFQNYILNLMREQNLNYKAKKIFYRIPYYLNGFVELEYAQIKPQSRATACQVLYRLCCWLKRKQFTDLTVIQQREQSQSA